MMKFTIIRVKYGEVTVINRDSGKLPESETPIDGKLQNESPENKTPVVGKVSLRVKLPLVKNAVRSLC